MVLTTAGLAQTVYEDVSALGFDPGRALFLQYVVMTLLGTIGAACLLRRRFATWCGGLSFFLFGYLVPYDAQAQHPVLSAYGAPQLLVTGAFVTNLATLAAVGFLTAGAGSVLGQAAGEIVAAPLAALWRLVNARIHAQARPGTDSLRSLVSSAGLLVLACLLGGAVLLAMRNVGAILTYGTTASLYQPAQTILRRGVIQSGEYRSPALGGSTRQFLIYLPPSYDSSPTRRFPVIYLLHGSPGGMSNWFGGANVDTTANDLFAVAKARETIFVSPDGNGAVYQFSQWANSLDGRQRMEDAIVDDLVPYIDAHYRTIAAPGSRVLAGISEGGFGAVNIALHHPGVFGAVMSLGGFYTAARSPVFGVGSPHDAIHRFNSPALYVSTVEGLASARAMAFIIGIATQDHGYYQVGMAFYHELRQLGMHVELISVTGGHSWQTWGTQFARALPLLEPPINYYAKVRNH